MSQRDTSGQTFDGRQQSGSMGPAAVGEEVSRPTDGKGGGDGRISSVTWMTTGFIQTKERFLIPGGGMGQMDMPVGFALLEHPVNGLGLFDTGLTQVFYGATRKMPFRLFRMITPMRHIRSAAQQVVALGKDIQDVKWIVVSHFDYDHVGGLGDFPAARIICHPQGWKSVRGKTGLAALKARSIPDFLSTDLEQRLEFVSDFPDPAPSPLEWGKDLFSDGSVLLVDLPGHAPGHLGMIFKTEDAVWFFVGDAVWSIAALRSPKDGFAHRLTSVDGAATRRTRAMLRQVMDSPFDESLRIVPTHCPEAWERWGRIVEPAPGGALSAWDEDSLPSHP